MSDQTGFYDQGSEPRVASTNTVVPVPWEKLSDIVHRNFGYHGAAPMLFLFGLRRKATIIGQFERACSRCGRQTVHSAIESQRWFTLFFIPLIPFGGSHSTRCNLCGLVLKGSPELKAQASVKAVAAGA